MLFNFFSEDATKTEVIDLGGTGTICDEHANFPVATSGAVGGLMDEKWPLICGGTNTESDCYFFNNQEWQKASGKTSVKRIYSASVIDQDGNLWITGGDGKGASTTSERIKLHPDGGGSVTTLSGPVLNMGGKLLQNVWLINNSINLTSNPFFDSYLQEGRSMHC